MSGKTSYERGYRAKLPHLFCLQKAQSQGADAVVKKMDCAIHPSPKQNQLQRGSQRRLSAIMIFRRWRTLEHAGRCFQVALLLVLSTHHHLFTKRVDANRYAPRCMPLLIRKRDRPEPGPVYRFGHAAPAATAPPNNGRSLERHPSCENPVIVDNRI